jgi:hypothetical protein
MWYRDDWTVKNVSPKAVMTFVEFLQVQYPNGQRVERIQQHEAFFHSQLINSGEDLNVSTGHPSGKMLVTGEAQLNALEISPSADVTVRWVQFADGTTFGDEKFASETLDLRKATYTTLAHLNHVYQAEEPARFLQELQSGTGSGEVDAYLGHLLRVGRQTARRSLRGMARRSTSNSASWRQRPQRTRFARTSVFSRPLTFIWRPTK